ncbi:MAG TPA: SulP family inorganic anion transporter [Dongiaceae bacterium]|nr:SulP family inorganic anion transporter [Dongiaceae bacterium]
MLHWRMALERFVPLWEQLRGYQLRWLRFDIVAGLSVAAVALPTAVAYPAIMGLPPQIGLYAAILPPVGYAIFGPSRRLMVGPDTATCMMVASAFIGLGISGVDERIAVAAAFAMVVGIACVAAGALGLGFIANFLSKPVLMGFLSGVALDLIIGQLGKLTRLSLSSGGLFGPLVDFVVKLPGAHPPTVILGLGLLAILRGLRRWAPGLPGSLIAVVLGTLLSVVLDFGGLGVTLVGAIPQGLPSPSFAIPSGLALDNFALAALGILIVSFSSGIVTARSFGLKYKYAVDANLELVGFGAANIASSLIGGFPVTGSDSRTAVNCAVGGKTQLAGLVAAAALTAAVLFFGSVLAYLPVAALSAILISAALDLIDTRGFVTLWRLSRIEFTFAIIGILSVLSLGVLRGVIIAVLTTLGHLIWIASRPRDAILGIIPNRDGLYKLHRHPDAAPIPGLTIYLPEGAVVFFNADYVKHRLLKSVARTPSPPLWLVLDASAIGFLDTTSVDALEDARATLAAHGIKLAVAGLHAGARRLIERSGLAARIGPEMIFHSAEDAADAYRAWQAKDSKG